jgi:hypothetical protein
MKQTWIGGCEPLKKKDLDQVLVIRASPIVWQNLFSKSCYLPTLKIIWGGKKDIIFNNLTNFVSKNLKIR